MVFLTPDQVVANFWEDRAAEHFLECDFMLFENVASWCIFNFWAPRQAQAAILQQVLVRS